MSKEATGQFGIKIGSREYWSRINRDVMLGGLMEDKTDYRAMLQPLGSRADDAIEEVYEDLSELGSKIRYLPSYDRNALAKQVEGLYDICRLGGVHARHSSECIQDLNLSVMSPWNSAFRDDRGIEKAIDIIKQSRYSGSEAVNLLNEAARWSIASAAERDPKKRAFLEAVSQINSSSRFLKDVVEEYQAQNGSHRYEGNCGHTIGSHSYRNHIELQVFGYVLPGFGGSDYEKMLRDALESVAERLERDLENAARENDYITDETAAKLKAVVDELERCGVSIGFLDSKIKKLAWFVGGDPGQIRRLQEALNAAGVGQRLKEDGVYGEQTRDVLEKLADKVPDFLKDLNKCRTLSLIVELAGAIGVASVEHWKVNDAIEKGGQLFLNTILNAGAEILQLSGCDVAALLLQHSLEWTPSNLHFSEMDMVTKKIMDSKGFGNAFDDLEQTVRKNPDTDAWPREIYINFQETGDRDLYYGIGKCKLTCTYIQEPMFLRVRFMMEDKYNFDEIRTIRKDDIQKTVEFKFGIGNLANDFGLLAQTSDVISPYWLYIEFEKTIALS